MRKCLSGITILAALLAVIPFTQGATAAPTAAGASGGQSPVTQTATSAGTTSTATPALGAEIVSKRTETTKTFATATPGLYVTKVYSQPVHYLDASGNWSDIDTLNIFFSDRRNYLFHPDAAGQQAMAGALVSAISANPLH